MGLFGARTRLSLGEELAATVLPPILAQHDRSSPQSARRLPLAPTLPHRGHTQSFQSGEIRNRHQIMYFKNLERNNNTKHPNNEIRKAVTLFNMANEPSAEENKEPEMDEAASDEEDDRLVIDEHGAVLEKLVACSQRNKMLLLEQMNAYRKNMSEKIKLPDKLTFNDQSKVKAVAENEPETWLIKNNNSPVDMSNYYQNNILTKYLQQHGAEPSPRQIIPQHQYQNMAYLSKIPNEGQEDRETCATPAIITDETYLARRQTMPMQVPTARPRPPISISPHGQQNAYPTEDHEEYWRQQRANYKVTGPRHSAQKRRVKMYHGPLQNGQNTARAANVSRERNTPSVMPQWQQDGTHFVGSMAMQAAANNNNIYPDTDVQKPVALVEMPNSNDPSVGKKQEEEFVKAVTNEEYDRTVIVEQNTLLDQVVAYSQYNKMVLIKQLTEKNKISTITNKRTVSNQPMVNDEAEHEPVTAAMIKKQNSPVAMSNYQNNILSTYLQGRGVEASRRQINAPPHRYQNVPFQNEMPNEGTQEGRVYAAPQNNIALKMKPRRQAMPALVPRVRPRLPVPKIPYEQVKTYSTVDRQEYWAYQNVNQNFTDRGAQVHYDCLRQQAQYHQQMLQNNQFNNIIRMSNADLERSASVMPSWHQNGGNMYLSRRS